jgi:type IV secretion system protein VirD4
MRHLLIAGVAIGYIFVTADEGLAQGVWGSSNLRYAYNPFEMAVFRIIPVVLSTALGFGLGWFLSPHAKELRRLILLATAALGVIVILFNNGFWGWGLSGLATLMGFFFGLGYWLSGVVAALAETPTTFGSAKWADIKEMNEKGLFADGGIRLGTVMDGEGEKLISYNGDRHGLIAAPNRSGKGTSLIVPNLLSYEGSMVIIDPKGENAMMTARHRMAMGQEVHIVDPWGITASTGIAPSRFNTMDLLKSDDPDLAENTLLGVDAAMVTTGGDNMFWEESSKSRLMGVKGLVATDPDEEGQRHLGRVRDLLLLDKEDTDVLNRKMLESPHHFIASAGAQALQQDEKLFSNVIASVQSQTHFLDSPRIRESLSVSDFKFEDLKTKPMTIYLVLPSDRLNTYGRWLRLLIQQAITVNARNIEKKPEKPVVFILDEMAALGKLTMIEQAYGLMAGYGIQLIGVVQDFSQLKRLYGDGWETFISNAGFIQYFGSRDRITSEYFSALCGETTIWNFSSAISSAFSKSFGGTGSSSSNSHSETDTRAAAQRKLIYPDELMRLSGSKQLILIENMNPIIAAKKPWFLDPELRDKGVNLQAK